jgi:hypothetical protein
MKLTLSATLALAASTYAQFDIPSPPFNLIVLSTNDTLNGTTVTACHSGAAIESLCLSTTWSPPLNASVFNFNTSNTTQFASPGSTLGVLTYSLQADPPIPETLDFYVEPTTDYAQPLFYPGESGQVLAVDEQNLFNVQGYVDYTVNPPKAGNATAYYRWYTCTTYYAGYEYNNVVWGLGPDAPETPGCVKVDLQRVFT